MEEGWYKIDEYESKESTIDIDDIPHANFEYRYYQTNDYKGGDVYNFFTTDGL